jgi:hypothetical protein
VSVHIPFTFGGKGDVIIHDKPLDESVSYMNSSVYLFHNYRCNIGTWERKDDTRIFKPVKYSRRVKD